MQAVIESTSVIFNKQFSNLFRACRAEMDTPLYVLYIIAATFNDYSRHRDRIALVIDEPL